MAVGIGAYFGQDVDGVVARLVSGQPGDGGWNCWAEDGAGFPRLRRIAGSCPRIP